MGLSDLWSLLVKQAGLAGAIGLAFAAITLILGFLTFAATIAMPFLSRRVPLIVDRFISKPPISPADVAATGQTLPGENGFFVGRDRERAELAKQLNTTGRAVLSGLGGTGKTQIALQYAYDHFRDNTANVYWVRSGSGEEVVTNLAALAARLGLAFEDTSDQEAVAKAVKATLEQRPDWLVVFDGADDPTILSGWLPVNPRGHVVVTSQATNFGFLGIAGVAPVGDMTPEDAEEFLLKRADKTLTDADREPLQDLIAELHRFPLALEQAGAYMAEKSIGFAEYLRLYRHARKQFLAGGSTLAGDYERTVATTWSVAFSRVKSASRASANLLRLSAFLHEGRIPYELLLRGAPHLGLRLFVALRWRAEKRAVIANLLQPLTRYSLVRVDVDDRSYSIHGLVQTVLRDQMWRRVQRKWVVRCVDALAASYPNAQHFKNWPLCDRLLLHSMAVTAHMEHHGIVFELAGDLLNNTGGYLNERARYSEAEQLHRRALAVREKALGPDHPDCALSINNLAVVCESQGRYGEAEPLFARAFAINEKVLGSEHPRTATSLNNLAACYRRQGRYAEAEPLYKRALAILEKEFGEDYRDVPIGLSILAALFCDQGRYAEAEPLYERALAIRERVFGQDHPDIATSLDDLAGLYQEQRRYADAEPLYDRALAIREKALGLCHPHTVHSLDGLAVLYRAQGRYAEAEQLIELALSRREKMLGPNHPDTAVSLNNLAAVQESQGRYGEAEQYYRRALTIWEKALGPCHPYIGTVVGSLAALYRGLGRHAEAEPLYERALAIREKVLGPDHPDTATGLIDLAALYGHFDRYAEAEPLFDRALLISRAALGDDHPATALRQMNLGRCLTAQERYAEAEPHLRQAASVLLESLGAEHEWPHVAVTSLAETLVKLGREDEARALAERAQAMLDEDRGDEEE